MLPTTKLFKSTECPFFNGSPDSCTRPYCHFNHVKPVYQPTPIVPPPVSTSNSTNVPVYIPTPKHILEANKTQDNGSNAKKIRLEYQPEAPAIIPLPILAISSTLHRKAAAAKAKLANANDNDNAIANHKANDNNVTDQEEIRMKNAKQLDDISGLLSDLTDDPINVEPVSDKKQYIQETEKNIKTNEKEFKKEHKNTTSNNKDSSSSSRSSSRSKHKSSHHKSSSSSSSSTRHHRSSKSSHHSKSSPSDRDKHKHKSNRSHRKSSTSSSSSSARRHSINEPKDSTERVNVSYDTESDDEDDVEAQCRMIFEEYEANNVSDDLFHASEPNNSEPTGISRSNEIALTETSLPKKRIAHENATKSHSTSLPAFKQSQNHVQNAMQSIHLRQQMVRKQQADARAKQTDVTVAEVYSQQQSKEQSATKNLTPLVPPAALQPPRAGPTSRTFAPVSNLLAIERAKAKVQQLRAEKMAQLQQMRPRAPQTVAQTTAKGTARVAHTNQVSQDEEAAPPVLEPNATKISYNVRMQYYKLMVNHCVAIYNDLNDGWERAQAEEMSVFKKCNTVNIYKSSALLTINKLRKESIDAGNVNTEKNKVESHDMILAGKHGQNTSWNVNRKPNSNGPPENIIDTIASTKAYTMIADLCLTDEQLKENGYPRPTSKSGVARIYKNQGAVPVNKSDRYCRRCGKLFKLDEYDEVCVDRCNYHPKSPGFRRGFADNLHRCCQQPSGTAGCMYADYHVTDYVDFNHMSGFVQTLKVDEGYVPTRKDIFALDCEMCYTTGGLELTRVTVVDINRTVVYDALVKPENRIVDYNTIYSGISEATLANVTRTLRDVQKMFRSMFNAKTVLIGHSLESDLKALKMIHNRVVDTSVLFPHKMGPPKKRALKTLCIENLKRIIQEDVGGHNSAEDAEVCIDLVKHYLRNRSV